MKRLCKKWSKLSVGFLSVGLAFDVLATVFFLKIINIKKEGEKDGLKFSYGMIVSR